MGVTHDDNFRLTLLEAQRAGVLSQWIPVALGAGLGSRGRAVWGARSSAELWLARRGKEVFAKREEQAPDGWGCREGIGRSIPVGEVDPTGLWP